MNTEETAQQLELAARIIRTGHPWEVWTVGQYEKPDQLTILDCIQRGHKIRLAPDLYAKLKKAHAEGKKIEYFDGAHWNPMDSPSWICSPNHYRIKPESTFQLPPPPPGMQWHRTEGWQDGDLPQGMRPLVLNEESKPGDEHWALGFGPWKALKCGGARYDGHNTKCRTRRPLTFTHAGKTWTWHRPRNPMPCDGNRRVFWLYQINDKYSESTEDTASHREWDWSGIIGWRYADEKKTVPLGPDDVPPGSVFGGAGEAKDPDDKGWCLITSCSRTGIRYWRHSDSDPAELSWKTIHESGAQINRSLPFTGKWNPDAWEPCSKEVDA